MPPGPQGATTAQVDRLTTVLDRLANLLESLINLLSGRKS
jgi:hypothetical protein